MFHYLTENYKFILPETLIYLRTMFQVYIREDSFTGSRKSGNFNVICDTCCNEINGADLLDRNRTKLKKYLGELQVIYADIQLEPFSNRQKSSFYSEHYNKAVSAMHECKIHCLIVKNSGAQSSNPVYMSWKKLLTLAEQYVEELDGIYEKLSNINIDDQVIKDDDKDDNDASGLKNENNEVKHLTFEDFKPESGVESYDV